MSRPCLDDWTPGDKTEAGAVIEHREPAADSLNGVPTCAAYGLAVT